jgi:hypothetical protein
MKPTTVSVAPRHPHAVITKAIVCLAEAGGDNYYQAARIAEQRVPALTVLPTLFEKAAVGALPLGSNDPFGFASETYIALLVEDLRALLARFTRVPPRLKIPIENASGGTAAWVGQGLPTAVVKSTTSVATLDVFKLAALTALTRELFRFDPNAEATFLRILRDDVSRFAAAALLDPTKAATSTNPASLTANAHAVASSGATAANMITDLNALISLIATAMADPVFVLQPRTFYRLAATLAGVGLNVTQNSLLGIPCVLLSGMPRMIVLLDAASVFYAGDDQAELSVSTDAVLEMSDAPSQSGISGAGASMVSLFQSSLVAIQATFTMNWVSPYMLGGSPNAPSGVAYMTTGY